MKPLLPVMLLVLLVIPVAVVAPAPDVVTFLSLLAVADTPPPLAAAVSDDTEAAAVESFPELLLLLLLPTLTTSWATLDEALRCLSPLILTISPSQSPCRAFDALHSSAYLLA